MRDVVVIGGGLTGLAAVIELQKHGVDTTLIEVKNRLGGSIQTVDLNGFKFDSGPMGHRIANPTQFEAYLKSLGLADSVTLAGNGHLVFKAGTGQLIDALQQRVIGPMMMRMAVSTLGMLDAKRFSICMENGMLLDARALIVAAPARHAERIFHTLTPEISFHLLDYRYDTITRVSLGYAGDGHGDLNLMYPQDSPVTESHSTSDPARVPDGRGTIVQAALRFEPDELPEDLVGELAALMRWPLNPDADHIATWTESDPAMWRTSDHPRTMAAINALMPSGVALVGSDYIASDQPPALDERVQQGVDAARQITAFLKS